MTIDSFDRAILRALQADGAMTNAALAEVVNLSASQCSRRRAALEASGLITGYSANLDPRALGFGMRALVRVNLGTHGTDRDVRFRAFLDRSPQVQSAFTVAGDADYVLDVRARDLEAYADFVHNRLLAHPDVAQVRSEIVMRVLKDRRELDLDAL